MRGDRADSQQSFFILDNGQRVIVPPDEISSLLELATSQTRNQHAVTTESLEGSSPFLLESLLSQDDNMDETTSESSSSNSSTVSTVSNTNKKWFLNFMLAKCCGSLFVLFNYDVYHHGKSPVPNMSWIHVNIILFGFILSCFLYRRAIRLLLFFFQQNTQHSVTATISTNNHNKSRLLFYSILTLMVVFFPELAIGIVLLTMELGFESTAVKLMIFGIFAFNLVFVGTYSIDTLYSQQNYDDETVSKPRIDFESELNSNSLVPTSVV